MLYMVGLRGRYISTPPSPVSHHCALAVPTQLLSRGRASAATYALALRSNGRSLRIPKRISAATHLCGGSALVNMSAA